MKREEALKESPPARNTGSATATVRRAKSVPARGSKVEAKPATKASGLSILARKVKALRTSAGMTLQELADRSGVSQSALSKIENGQISPTYEKIAALAKGLHADVAELFSESSGAAPVGRRGITRRGKGVSYSTAQYDYEVLCADLSGRQFLPLLATIKAHSVEEFPELAQHDGEEFVYVLSGEVTLHSEFYEPLPLRAGDCCYYDSSMRHGLVSAGAENAVVLWISSRSVPLDEH